MKSQSPLQHDSIRITFTIIFLTLLFAVFPFQLQAKVSGVCSNCHTMHNSQNGVIDPSGTNDNLLNGFNEASSCIGCHSSADAATWKDGTTGAPIVWNQTEPTFNTQKGLAGGNFYWVGAGDDTKGHNVYGVGTAPFNDDKLDVAPGRTVSCSSSSCHFTLAEAPNTYADSNGGCEGCHTKVSHHDDSNNWYRFLKGHGLKTDTDYVIGQEDDDWEYETTNDHNWYQGTTSDYNAGNALATYNSISAYCSGCHGAFHGSTGMGDGTPWIRHPTDIALPQGDSSEYSGYDLTDSGTYVNYSAEAPVAWTDSTNTGNRGTPIVMCLSCHRPHGSQYPDMLRWDYNNMEVGTTGISAGTGCFTCHTEKDGS